MAAGYWVYQMSYLGYAGPVGGLLHILGAPTQRMALESAVYQENIAGLARRSGLPLCLFVSSRKPLTDPFPLWSTYKAFPIASGISGPGWWLRFHRGWLSYPPVSPPEFPSPIVWSPAQSSPCFRTSSISSHFLPLRTRLGGLWSLDPGRTAGEWVVGR